MPGEDALALLARRCGVHRADIALRRAGLYADVYEAGDLIVKCATGERGPALLAREAALLAQLPGDLPAAVPRPVLVSAEHALMVYPRLPGAVVSGAEIMAWPGERRQRLAGDLGAFMAALHRVRCAPPPVPPVAVEAPVPGRAPPPRWLKRQLRRWRAQAGAAPLCPGATPVLIHDDLNVTNLLTGPDGRLLGVLDFAIAKHGPAVMDFRKFWLIGRVFRDDVLAAHAAAGGGPIDAEELACAEAKLLMRFVHRARIGEDGAGERLLRVAKQRRAMERAMRRRQLFGPRQGPAQARPMAETVAIQTTE